MSNTRIHTLSARPNFAALRAIRANRTTKVLPVALDRKALTPATYIALNGDRRLAA